MRINSKNLGNLIKRGYKLRENALVVWSTKFHLILEYDDRFVEGVQYCAIAPLEQFYHNIPLFIIPPPIQLLLPLR